MGPQPPDGSAVLWADRVCRAHLDEVLAASEDTFFVFDRRGACVYAYGADLPLWGHDRWACLGKTPREIWTWPALHEPFERWFEAVLARGVRQSEEVGLDTIFGRRWFSFTLHPIGARPSGPEAVSVAVRDISERKQLAGALGAGHEPGQALNTLFGTVLHDQGRIVSVDHGLAEMLGYPVEALIGRPIDQILSPATDGGPGPRRGRAIRADGIPIAIDLKDERVTIEAGTWIMTSVFNRQAHEREAWGLLDAADRWRSLVESTVHYIVATTVTGEVTFINRTPPGFDRGRILGASLFTFMTPIVRKEKRRLMDEVIRTGGVYTHEAYFQDPVAGTTWLRTTLSPIRRGDAIVGVLWSACDVTEVRRLAETLAGREREVARLRELDALKEQLIGIVAHELRTPLTAMRGYAELLGDGTAGPLSALQRQFLRQIVASTKRQTMLVDTLLDRTRLDSGLFKLSCEKADLAAVIRETVDALMPIIEDAGLTITVGPIDPVPPMTIDARRIDEVLANLLTNAIRYVPSGGHVRVSLSRQAEGVLLEVVDNGPGIPPKDQARLFQRLSQLDAGRREGMGLGLGLWICKSIIEAHGGTIGVESRPGEGATFWFTLPGPA